MTGSLARTRRQTLSLGFIVTAILLIVTSTAYACTYFWGYMEATGDASSATSYRAGTNDAQYMTYCPGAPKYNGAQTYHNGGTDITVSVGRTGYCGGGQLSSNYDPYDVNFLGGTHGQVFDSNGNWLINCMSGGGGIYDGQVSAALTVGSNGAASGTYDLSGITIRGEGAVCVSDPQYYQGNQVPMLYL